MSGREHDLKIWPEYFDAVVSGQKTFEFSRDARDFETGDGLVLREWDPKTEEYTGREKTATVGYIFHTHYGEQRFAILSILTPPTEERVEEIVRDAVDEVFPPDSAGFPEDQLQANIEDAIRAAIRDAQRLVTESAPQEGAH